MSGPIDGVRVIDLSRIVAGPLATQILGDYGAEILKIEQPGIGDDSRAWTPPVAPDGSAAYFYSVNRNKKSVTLDLRKAEGAELFKQLVAKSDVLCENFQTGTLEGWGLGWETLRQVNPGLIMVRITGYGQTGPYTGKPGFARIAQVFRGVRNDSG